MSERIQKATERRAFTFVEFKKSGFLKKQGKHPLARKMYDAIIKVFEDSTKYVGQYVLVVERHVEDKGKMGCFGWERPPRTRTHLKLGVLRSADTRLYEALWQFEFDTGRKVVSGDLHSTKGLRDGNLEAGFGLKLVKEVYGEFENNAPEMEIVIGDEAVEKWFAPKLPILYKRHVFDEMCELLAQPNRFMREKADKELGEKRKEVLERLDSYSGEITEDMKLAKSLGLAEHPSVIRWEGVARDMLED